MTERLEQTLTNYKAIRAICNKAFVLTNANQKYVNEFSLPILGKKTADYTKDVQDYFDNLQDRLLENFYLELFAGFEATIIEKVGLASGEMTKTLKQNYNPTLPFQTYEDIILDSIESTFVVMRRILAEI